MLENTPGGAAAAQSQPTPAHIFRTITAYQETACLKAAIELDVFTAIAQGAQTSPEIARHCQAAERGVRILCDALTVLGLLRKSGDAYSLMPDAAMFLVKGSPAYAGTAVGFLASPMTMRRYDDFTEKVRRGGAGPEGHQHVSTDDPMWTEFARSMGDLMRWPAQMLAQMLAPECGPGCRVLDIAGGHGVFGIALGQQIAGAEVTELDWPHVLEVARDNARAAGIAERYKTLAGDAFATELGGPYDVVLVNNFLHHFDAPTCEKLLGRVREALKPQGRVAGLEFMPNPDRVSPPAPALFSVTMLAATEAGDAYTFAELESMLRKAGFKNVERRSIPGLLQEAFLARK